MSQTVAVRRVFSRRYAAVWALALTAASAVAEPKAVSGYIERVTLFPGGLNLRVKVDTGAKHSSLNAQQIRKFRKGSEDWVRFAVTNSKGRSVVFERPVLRRTTIRRHHGRKQERPVLTLGICLGATYKEVEVNLVDRTGFNYQMLIGRSFLSGDFVVDVDKSFVLPPACPEPPAQGS